MDLVVAAFLAVVAWPTCGTLLGLLWGTGRGPVPGASPRYPGAPAGTLRSHAAYSKWSSHPLWTSQFSALIRTPDPRVTHCDMSGTTWGNARGKNRACLTVSGRTETSTGHDRQVSMDDD